MHGKNHLRSNSNAQQDIGVSSGENEWYGLLKGGSAGLGAKALAADWEYDMAVPLATDSSAAKSVSQCRGLGKIRHIATRYMWLQQKTYKKEVLVEKVDGEKNYADLQTKHLAERRMVMLLNKMGYYYQDGRSYAAPKVLGTGQSSSA